MANENGVWRTIGGRRVFIKEGQDLASAMKESGKFKSNQKAKDSIRKIGDTDINQLQKLAQRVRDKNDSENIKAVSDYENGAIDREELLKRFDGNEDKMKEAFEKMGYTAPTKENIDRANANARQRAEERKNAMKGADTSTQEKVLEDFKNSDGSKENFEKALNKISEMEYNNEINPDEYKDYISKIQNEYVEKNRKANSDREELRNKDNDKDYNLSYYDENGEKQKVKFSELKEKAKENFNKNQEKIKKMTDELGMGEKNEFTREELKARYGTDDVDLINAGREKENRVSLKEEKSTNDIMNEKIRSRGKSKVEEDDLPKHTEIKTQGTSNRKEVSENIQAHILDYYTEDYTGEDIPATEAFVRQMDAMGEPNMWRAGQRIAEGGSYLIYNGDMADFLNELKINPKGKTFSEDKAFDMYTSLIGRESAKLYDRIQKNSYKKYMKAHPLSKMSFEEFKDMNKK